MIHSEIEEGPDGSFKIQIRPWPADEDKVVALEPEDVAQELHNVAKAMSNLSERREMLQLRLAAEAYAKDQTLVERREEQYKIATNGRSGVMSAAELREFLKADLA